MSNGIIDGGGPWGDAGQVDAGEITDPAADLIDAGGPWPLPLDLLEPPEISVVSNHAYADVADPGVSLTPVSPRTYADVVDPSTGATVILP